MDPSDAGPGAGMSPVSPFTTPASAASEDAAHDLLLALAGRLPDRLLWRLRDWLDAGAHVALRSSVPRTLLRHRVAVTDAERRLLATMTDVWGGPPRLVEAILRTDAAPDPSAAFEPSHDAAGWDPVDLVLRALAPAVGDVHELRRTWRTDQVARRGTPTPPVRVVLVRASARRPELAATLARCLRAHGELPRVEVMADRAEVGPYHRAALAGSEALWTPRDGLRSAGPARGPDRSPSPELVGHG